ncbi:MAG: metallophosphoesterase [Haloarculaceae archaeon]
MSDVTADDAADAAGDRTYYFISDLHIGGDEALRAVDFEAELLSFLADLERTDEDAALIINGDCFGLWEFTELEGLAKFDALVERYPELFAQLRRTGETVPITVIPGNHDYELAAYDEYVERLAEYNVRLEQETAITRSVGEHTVWIEHGMQQDPNNRIPDFGNPFANPAGYFVNRHFTSKAGQLSERGKFNWLKDIQSVTPMEQIPEWLLSKYFYREMSPLLRYAAVPFLLLFNVSVLYLVVVLLAWTGIWPAPYRFIQAVIAELGLVGTVLDALLIANLAVVVLLSIVAAPLYVYLWDVRRTLDRFGIVLGRGVGSGDAYLDRAREVFAAHPDVGAFVYGHTHRVSFSRVDGRAVINTGTWLKRLRRTPSRVGVLPPVFYPSFRLSYVRVTAEDGDLVIEYDEVEKADPADLTLLERVVSVRPEPDAALPDRVVIEG